MSHPFIAQKEETAEEDLVPLEFESLPTVSGNKMLIEKFPTVPNCVFGNVNEAEIWGQLENIKTCIFCPHWVDSQKVCVVSVSVQIKLELLMKTICAHDRRFTYSFLPFRRER